MLEVEDLWVHYGSLPAVRGVSFDVREGEIVGLIGPNGAGKTTTLKAVIGLLKATRGAVRLDGQPVTELGPEAMLARGVALVPEGRQVFGTLTVAENLRLGATLLEDRSDLDAEIERMLDVFPGLRKHHKAMAARLSGGEQQQLAIARALLAKPRLLLLDEPSLGLAPQVIDIVFEVLAGLREQGITVLLVEQNVVRTMEFVDRFYVLRTGTVSVSGDQGSLGSEEELMQRYLGF
jgi:branched-chain amino acid transport system ATP-binding protein